MVSYEHMNLILYELEAELKHQNAFLEKIKEFNKQLDLSEGNISYSVQQVISVLEQNTSSIRKAISQLPLEEDPD